MMKLSYRGRVWLHGLINALLTGMLACVPVIITDPKDFNLFDGGAQKLGSTALVFALIGLYSYMKDHPIPDPEKDTDAPAAVQKIVDRVSQKTDQYTADDIARGLATPPPIDEE